MRRHYKGNGMNTETREIYETIIRSKIEAQKPYIPVDVDLWDSIYCAAFLKCSKEHFMQRYAPRPDFPQSVRLPSEKRGTPRWKAIEVIEWASTFQESRAA
jgi:predicted DNA-binding transcriptional regulator AlpA